MPCLLTYLFYPFMLSRPVCLQNASELVLRATTPFNFCVIDEVDSILIDEARTPLIISGPSDKPSDKYYKVRPCQVLAVCAPACTQLPPCFPPPPPPPPPPQVLQGGG